MQPYLLQNHSAQGSDCSIKPDARDDANYTYKQLQHTLTSLATECIVPLQLAPMQHMQARRIDTQISIYLTLFYSKTLQTLIFFVFWRFEAVLLPNFILNAYVISQIFMIGAAS